MNDYPDTSFLCAAYREQDNSTTADAYRDSMTESLGVSTLPVFEFRQAIRLQVWLHAQDKKKGTVSPRQIKCSRTGSLTSPLAM